MRQLCLLFIFCTLGANAQEKNNHPLKVGDHLPPGLLENIIHTNSKRKSINTLKGKLIIIDFWNVQCQSCIKAMPNLDALQKQFKEKLQIILITKNTQNQVDKLFEKIKIKKPHIPMLTGDQNWNAIFPHEGDPLHVWIDQNGLIRFITNGYNATAYNIQKFLEGKNLNLSNVSDLEGFDPEKSLLTEAAGRLQKNTSYYSILMRGLEEVTTSNRIELFKDPNTRKTYSIRSINTPILTLIGLAYNPDVYGFEIDPFWLRRNNRIIIESTHPELLYPPKDSNIIDDWIRENQFSYEVKVPANKTDAFYMFMQEDINRLLDYECHIEKRKLKCWVLRQVGPLDNIRNEHDDQKPGWGREDSALAIRNMTLTQGLIKPMIYANCFKNEPIVSLVDSDEHVDLILYSNLNDLVSLQKELTQYNLSLSEEDYEANMIIIHDKAKKM